MSGLNTTPRSPGWRLTTVFVVGALVGAVSAVEVVPEYAAGARGSTTTIVEPGATDDAGPIESGQDPADGGTGGPVDATTAGGTTGPARGASKLTCSAAGNGGATDHGVTATEIRLATTVVDSGIGAAFLRDVRFAMEAVRNKVNREGGICGRKLVIRYVDDGWDAQKGQQFLRNFINEPDPSKKIFAIPVGPSSEGLRVVIESGDIDRTRTPVVGTDGMLIDQYVRHDGKAQPWVWPVAAATVASARIMARDAYERGARNFSIVFDRNYRFGEEAALAFNAEVKRLTGSDVAGFNRQLNCQRSFCGVYAGESSYSAQVQTFEEGDFVALFLEPQTALTWMNDPNTPPANSSSIRYGYGAGQPLFTRSFAVNCQSKCDQMTVWTGFKPYLEDYKNDPAVRAYVEDLKRTNPQADEFNAFAQGGYVGMLLLVEALKETGPNLTRARLKAALDRVRLGTGLTIQESLRWPPDNRFAATTMQAFQIQYKGTFAGWRSGAIVKDPRPQAGTS